MQLEILQSLPTVVVVVVYVVVVVRRRRRHECFPTRMCGNLLLL